MPLIWPRACWVLCRPRTLFLWLGGYGSVCPTAQTELKERYASQCCGLCCHTAQSRVASTALAACGLRSHMQSLCCLCWLTLLGLTHVPKGSSSTCGCDTVAPLWEFPDGDAFLYEVSVTSGISSNFLGKYWPFGKRIVSHTDIHFPKLCVLLESSYLYSFLIKKFFCIAIIFASL